MNPLAKFIPTRDRLLQIVRDQAEHFRRGLVESAADNHPPTLLVYARPFIGPGELGPESIELAVIVGIDWDEDAPKRAALDQLGRTYYARKIMPTAAVLVSEAWRSKRRDVAPRDDPQREEVIVITACAANAREAVTACLPVTRLRGRMLPGAVELNEEQTGQSSLLSTFFAGFAHSNPFLRERN